MKTVIVVGSHRPVSESARVAEVLGHFLQTELSQKTEVSILDLGKSPLPIWDEEMWSSEPTKWTTIWSPISKTLSEADSFVFISPEYAGMASPALKNFFLFATSGQLSHKPALIVSVSSGMGGAYPVAELRMSSYKNSHLCFIPEQLIVRKVNDLFHAQEKGQWSEEEVYIRKRMSFALRQLAHYSNALKDMRNAPDFDAREFPYGM